MKKIIFLLILLGSVIGIQAQEHETPNAQQAHRMFMDIYNKVYGDEGATLHYKVNIIGLYKTEGTIWMKQKKSKFIDEKYIAWNDDVTFHRLERKKKRIVIYDAHSEERDKYAAKFKFIPDNYTYSIKDEKNKGIAITLKAKKGVKGIKEARVMLDRQTHAPTSIRIKVGIFHTTIKISNFKVGDISDDLFKFPKDQYKNYEYEDKR
jgi:outer membrane lipoprotein-sorting protein